MCNILAVLPKKYTSCMRGVLAVVVPIKGVLHKKCISRSNKNITRAYPPFVEQRKQFHLQSYSFCNCICE